MIQQQLFKGRDKRKKGWFWIDNDYLNGYAKFFGATGTAIYVSLCRHVNIETQKCFPAMKTIAEENNIGINTVKQYVKIFEKYHLLSINREKDPRTKRWLNNVYTLLDKTEWIRPEEPIKKKRVKSQSQSLAVGSQSQRNDEPEPKKDESQGHTMDNKETHSKETHIKDIATLSVADNINKLIERFKPINPSYEQLFKNTTQRKALERLVKKHGEEAIIKIIDILPKIFGKIYAPRITTPYQLEQKLGDLFAYLKERSEEKINFVDLTKL